MFGLNPNSYLSKKGESSMKTSGKYIQSLLGDQESELDVISSPVERARGSILAILKGANINKKNVTYKEDAALSENSSAFSGKNINSVSDLADAFKLILFKGTKFEGEPKRAKVNWTAGNVFRAIGFAIAVVPVAAVAFVANAIGALASIVIPPLRKNTIGPRDLVRAYRQGALTMGQKAKLRADHTKAIGNVVSDISSAALKEPLTLADTESLTDKQKVCEVVKLCQGAENQNTWLSGHGKNFKEFFKNEFGMDDKLKYGEIRIVYIDKQGRLKPACYSMVINQKTGRLEPRLLSSRKSALVKEVDASESYVKGAPAAALASLGVRAPAPAPGDVASQEITVQQQGKPSSPKTLDNVQPLSVADQMKKQSEGLRTLQQSHPKRPTQ